MSQENVELWRAQIEAVRGGTSESDREAMLVKIAGLWDPEIEWDASEATVFDISGVFRGIEAVQGWWREFLAAWESVRFQYDLIDAGDHVVMLLDQQMLGRSTGIDVPVEKYAQVVTFREGLIVHWKLYQNQAEALESVGLSE